MMGTTSSHRELSLFAYHVNLERRVRADHPLRQLDAALDLSFVVAAVQGCYGRSGHVSLDPRVIMKLMVLLFYYDIPSERELLEQLGERLDFLWFLGFDLETAVPHHSVLSKARARWGAAVFEQLFVRTVQQCVQAGLVDGRLLHVDSTMVKANASKNSVVATSPEMVAAVRAACQAQTNKLTVLPPPEPAVTTPEPAATGPVPVSATVPEAVPEMGSAPAAAVEPVPPPEPVTVAPAPEPAVTGPVPMAAAVPEVVLAVVSAPAAAPASPKKLPVNQTHVSLTDPQALLARCKNGTTGLAYKEHRAVDDAHGVITAVQATVATVADGSRLPALVTDHQRHTGLASVALTVAGDGHYGTAGNYLYCAAQDIRAHLAEAGAHLEKRGKLPLSQFAYEPATDRYRCPQGHYLALQQNRPELQARVYAIEDPAQCAACPLREQCTTGKKGRSLQVPVQAAAIAHAQAEARSPAGRYSRKRRKHVMEGSFADAANNHGSQRARWRGLARQQLQGWLICAVQNLRRLIDHRCRRPRRDAGVGTVLLVGPQNPSQNRKIVAAGQPVRRLTLIRAPLSAGPADSPRLAPGRFRHQFSDDLKNTRLGNTP